ncbi:MAG: AAA family ATPase, partial [Actinobacteria bacterium]|nr:AAA family ATPase [Actinomycetota bacterium]
MRFRRVKAQAFGPLVDAELEFGEGLTVVWGPNEAAKSSWHSAMYAALCGRRRRSGRSVADEDFRQRHQPWGGDRWAVSADIDLDDGRHVSISRDLANRQSDVLDVTLGRTVDDEIMNEGSPDGALWLGLDRTTFLSTACIRQAEIAAVTASPDGLKHLLQQAASTLGGDVTASDALLALSRFRKDNVGQDRANAVKPLRLANEAVALAESKLGGVQRRQQEYLTLVAERELTRASVGAAEQALADVEVSVQRGRYREEVRRSQQLTDLLAVLPTTTDSVVSSTELDQLEHLLAQWSTLSTSSSAGRVREVGAVQAEIAALRQELGDIPDQPPGDVGVAEPVREAHAALEIARAATVASSSPSEFSGPELEVLREAHRLARLAQSPGPADEGIVVELDAARTTAAARHQQLRVGTIARTVGGGALLVAVALGMAGLASVAAGVAALGAVGLGVFWWSRQLAEVPVAELEVQLRDHQQALEAHRAQARAAMEFLSHRGLPFDLDQIHELLEARAVADANRARLVSEQKYHRREVQLRQDRLADALAQRGVAIDTSAGSPDTGTLDEALASYLGDVHEAALVAEQRRGIDILAQRLKHNIETEQRIIKRIQ